jgi:hypothetical protein
MNRGSGYVEFNYYYIKKQVFIVNISILKNKTQTKTPINIAPSLICAMPTIGL